MRASNVWGLGRWAVWWCWSGAIVSACVSGGVDGGWGSYSESLLLPGVHCGGEWGFHGGILDGRLCGWNN